jgi:hypothetical protein
MELGFNKRSHTIGGGHGAQDRIDEALNESEDDDQDE